MLDDEGHLAEARPVGIVEGKVDDGVAEIVHGGDLLEPAEAAAHAGRQNDKSRFLHDASSFAYAFIAARQ